MRLHARHGWSYDADFWAALATALGELHRDDRGYAGPPRADPVSPVESHILIGHSLGAMRMLAEIGPSCRGLVSINGFDRFTATAGFAGVPLRVVDRMLHHCTVGPEAAVSAFRARCGDTACVSATFTPRLHEDLRLLRDGDARRPVALPLLRLDGANDPILLPAHRAACFAGAPAQQAADGGHLLPLTHARWCAEAIAAFVATLS